MTTKALVFTHAGQDGVSDSVLQVQNRDFYEVAPGLTWIDCAPECDTTWKTDGKTAFPPSAPAETVEQKRARCRAELNDSYQEQLAAGAVWNGSTWGLSYRDQSNVTGINVRATSGHGLPLGGATYPRKDKNGVTHELTEANFLALGVAISDRLAALVHDPALGLEAHRAAIDASDDPDSLKPWVWPPAD